jgi:ParB/RepB/Spo0J family partition protein
LGSASSEEIVYEHEEGVADVSKASKLKNTPLQEVSTEVAPKRSKLKRGTLKRISLDKIDEPSQVFRVMTGLDSTIEEMAKSIKNLGLIYPPIVREKEDGRYEIVVGHLRYLAAKKAGEKEILCDVRKLDDLEALELQITENLQRREMDDIEKGRMLKYLLEKYPTIYPTHEAVADRLGISRSRVTQLVNIVQKYQHLPPDVQKKLSDAQANKYRTLLLQSKLDSETQLKLLEEFTKRSLKYKDAKKAVKLVLQGKPIETAIKEVTTKPTYVCLSCGSFKPTYRLIMSGLCEDCKQNIQTLLKNHGWKVS